MKLYKIKKAIYDKHSYCMVISDSETGEQKAEYRMTPGCERQEMAQTRRAIDAHLAAPGNGLGNYQW